MFRKGFKIYVRIVLWSYLQFSEQFIDGVLVDHSFVLDLFRSVSIPQRTQGLVIVDIGG